MSKNKKPKKENPNKDEVVKHEAVKDEAVKDDAIIVSPTSDDPVSPEQTLTDKVAVVEENAEPVITISAEDIEPVTAAETNDSEPTNTVKPKRRIPFLGLLNLLLIILLAIVAFYYWQMQQQSQAEKQTLLLELQSRLDNKANLAQIQSQLTPLKSGIGNSAARIETLQKNQQALQDSTEKLFDLFGRGDNDWQLAEVAYLMRVAQHKLALENDFEGAALTLQAASDKIATTADPGLLPVRVLISEEIADLKTRTRPDLVGMTLLLSQMGQQIHSLKPGYQPAAIVDSKSKTNELVIEGASAKDASIEEKVKSFFSNLVTVKRNAAEPTTTEALIINIEEIMEANLKLTRWTVLERDDFQYRQLMQENVRLFKQYYDLDDAANNDFYGQLLQLQKSPIKPSKPAIDGSLQLLKNIISQRKNAPDPGKVNNSKVNSSKVNSSNATQSAPKAINEVTDHV